MKTMKKIIPLILLFALVAVSCNRAELERVNQENAQLKEQLASRDADMESYMQVFNEIGDNLADIRAREKMVVKNSATTEKGDRVASVKEDILAIDEMMKQNKENLAKLNDRLKNSTGENSQLKRMVQTLQTTILEKDQEIVEMVAQLKTLNVEVQDLYSSVSDLRMETIEQGKVIDTQVAELNTAWYVIGSEKDLREKEIITKEGGFIGIGRVNKLNRDFDSENFTQIDIRKKMVFDLDVKKVKLITSHPSDSYLLRRNDDTKKFYSFEILDPEAFWKNSNFMVMTVE
jgi:predicted nuclease with TOPRIM domain